jgi:hypothetical protein
MTPQGQALADHHRVAQGRLAALTASQMLRLFPLLVTGGTIDLNTARWLEVALAALTTHRAASAALAAQFATAFRMIESGTLDGFSPAPAITLPIDAVTTSLMVLGPQAYRREVARQLGVEPRDLTERALADARLPRPVQDKLAANTARAAMRHVQNGARDTLDNAIREDKAVVGYVRTTSGTPCYFCAMLASRGPVYQDDSFADSDPRFHGPGDQKVHDGCGCMLLPMYRRAGKQWPGRAKEFDALWRANPSITKFRQAYEGR